PMYLVGAPHPHKTDAQFRIERFLNDRERLVTDAEVLQEILHRYVAIKRPDAIQPAFDALLKLVDEVLPIEGSVVEHAKQVVFGHPHLSARDAVHVAIMERHGIKRIFSFDSGFDGLPVITRIA
ncbi:MAG: type II toxin-antitoxin system VapC family toxin, partial [Candidatus Sulfotelmatobacter sp.]